jgi:starch-binding outer membrane protein, SusD/RagB family
MTSTTRILGTVVGAVLLASCGDMDVRNTNAPTAETLAGSPSRGILARTAIGIQVQAFNDLAGEIQQFGIYGREGWNLLGNDPRETGEELIANTQDPGGRAGGNWGGKYQSIRTINAYLAAIENNTDLSAAEKAASRGFARTIKAWHIHRLAIRTGSLGIPIAVGGAITDPPAPFVSFANAMLYATALMDSADTDLAAGGTAFPFSFVPGYTGFTTPATFRQFNRGLAAKILVHRATFVNCTTCWAQASTAMNASFVTTTGLPGSLATGVYYGYTGAAGELSNPVTENLTSNRYWVHPSIVTGAQLRTDGSPDLRLTTKTMAAASPRTLNGLTATHKPVMFNSTSNRAVANTDADIPWLINEELLLLRAEIRWNTGDKAGAISDINLVRQHAGGLPASSLTILSTDAAFVTELLYNRLYSLMWTQGTRWIDARRYNRVGTLPIDRAGDGVHPQMLVPAAECDARGLTVPCSPPTT